MWLKTVWFRTAKELVVQDCKEVCGPGLRRSGWFRILRECVVQDCKGVGGSRL